MQDAIILYENGKAIGGEGHPTDADDITFDNTGTDIVANKVGSAIKEVNEKTKCRMVELWKTTDTSGTYAAGNIDIDTNLNIEGFYIEFCNASYNTIQAFSSIGVGMYGKAQYEEMHPTTSKMSLYIRELTSAQITGGYRLSVGNCTLYLQSAIGTAPNTATSNTVIIPYRIWGIVKND